LHAVARFRPCLFQADQDRVDAARVEGAAADQSRQIGQLAGICVERSLLPRLAIEPSGARAHNNID